MTTLRDRLYSYWYRNYRRCPKCHLRKRVCKCPPMTTSDMDRVFREVFGSASDSVPVETATVDESCADLVRETDWSKWRRK